MSRVTFEILPWQHRALEYENELIPIVGGLGSGKSWLCAEKYIRRIFRYPKSIFWIVVPTLKAAKAGTLVTFKAALDDHGITWRENKTDLTIHVKTGPRYWTEVKTWPATEWQRLKSIEMSTIWADECQEWENGEAAFEFLVGRRRLDPLANHAYGAMMSTQLLMSANPPRLGKAHWLYTKLVKQKIADFVFYVTTYDNHILLERDPTYLPRLQRTLSPEMFDIDVLGKWSDGVSGRVYYAFKEAMNVLEI